MTKCTQLKQISRITINNNIGLLTSSFWSFHKKCLDHCFSRVNITKYKMDQMVINKYSSNHNSLPNNYNNLSSNNKCSKWACITKMRDQVIKITIKMTNRLSILISQKRRQPLNGRNAKTIITASALMVPSARNCIWRKQNLM